MPSPGKPEESIAIRIARFDALVSERPDRFGFCLMQHLVFGP
jgi:hypothetical protein